MLAALRRVLDYGERLELIARNPARRLDAEAFGRDRVSTTRSLTLDEIDKLYAVAGDYWIGNLVRLGIMIGGRPGELTALWWDAVDLERGEIDIRRSRRKTGPGRYEVVDDLKVSKSRRRIALPATAVAVLRDQRAKVLEAQVGASSWPDPELVFPSPAGTLLDLSNVRRDMKRMCVDAGVPPVGPNAVRHSVASQLAEVGESPARVAHLLGHATPATTWRYYTHRMQESADASLSMEALLKRSESG